MTSQCKECVTGHNKSQQSCLELAGDRFNANCRNITHVWCSLEFDGCFCIYCVAFSTENERARQVSPIHRPYSNWKKARDYFNEHFYGKHASGVRGKWWNWNLAHMNCMAKSKGFLAVRGVTQQQPTTQSKQALEARIKKNKEVLSIIVETVVICGEQNFRLRGHRDDAEHENDHAKNPGNFKALLKYRIKSGETVLEEHTGYTNVRRKRNL